MIGNDSFDSIRYCIAYKVSRKTSHPKIDGTDDENGLDVYPNAEIAIKVV